MKVIRGKDNPPSLPGLRACLFGVALLICFGDPLPVAMDSFAFFAQAAGSIRFDKGALSRITGSKGFSKSSIKGSTRVP